MMHPSAPSEIESALLSGRIVDPVPGTKLWKGGKLVGIWGISVPLAPHLQDQTGGVRPLTPAEEIELARLSDGGNAQ